MAYDDRLANRIRRAFGDDGNVTERKMFGGLAFLWRGRKSCGLVFALRYARSAATMACATWRKSGAEMSGCGPRG